MPIPASQIVQVNPRVIPGGASNLEFNGLILTKNSSIISGNVVQFSDSEGVYDFFGAESTEARLAEVYFLGYNNSFIKPKKLFFAKYSDTASPAYIRGASLSDFAPIKEITDGELTLYLSEEISLTGLDFSSATTFSNAAQILQEAIHAASENASAKLATVEFSSQYNAFVITNGETGAASTVDYAKGYISGTLGLTRQFGAVLSQGQNAQTPKTAMEAVMNETQNWVNFTTAFELTQEEVLGFASWANGKGVDYLFVYVDNDPKLLQTGNKETIAYALKQENMGAAAGCYGSLEYAVFIMAIGASIDWNRNNAMVTTAFKAQSGLPANVTNAADATNLISQGMNFVGDYATRNDNFIFHYPGQMFGDYKWIDAYWGAVWMKNQIQAACMQGFENVGRASYNERGYTQVKAWIQDPVNKALNNGVIDAGVVLSEAQKVQINQEVGKDVAGDIEYTGYYLEVKDPGADARVNRDSPIINFYYTYGGAINRLDIPATMLS